MARSPGDGGLTPKQRAKWERWVASRPPVVADLARRFPPWEHYRLDPPGQIVSVVSYAENGTLTVLVEQEHNPHLLMLFDRQVFGVKPEDLHEMAAIHSEDCT